MLSEFVQEKSVTSWKSASAAHFRHSHLAVFIMGINKINVNNTDSNYAHSIFDISEYTGKSYATLSDALSDVPDGKKKCGMTVAFV